MGGIFLPTLIPKSSGDPERPAPPPHTPRKDIILQFWHLFCVLPPHGRHPNTTSEFIYMAPKSKYLTWNQNKWIFVPSKTSLVVRENLSAPLSPTLLPIGDGKKCILGLTSYNNQVSLTTKIWRNVGEVHSPGYPAEVRADIWHPALTEAHLKGKGLFVLKNVFFPLDFVENCKFLISKYMIFHESTRFVTWIHCRCLQTVQPS